MSFSVGDFAEKILAEEQRKAVNNPPSYESDSSFYSANSTHSQVDISKVEVPNDFVNSIVEGKEPIVPLEESVAPDLPVTQEVPVVSDNDQDMRAVMEDVKQLLIQLKETLTEMTTVGAMGVNLANNPKKNEKEDAEEEDAMTALLKRINKKRKAAKR
jgi:hypothetical protein